MSHIHEIYDTDSHYRIDPITKNIINESESKRCIVKGDHNSEVYTFEIPRTIEGHDMSLCNAVEVHYINIESRTGESSKGVYQAEDLQISKTDPEVVLFSWIISANATKYAGSLSFIVKFKCIEDGEITYTFNTTIYSNNVVADGIDNGGSVIITYPDLIEKWKADIISDLNTRLDTFIDNKDKEITESFNSKSTAIDKQFEQKTIAIDEQFENKSAEVDRNMEQKSNELDQRFADKSAEVDQKISDIDASTKQAISKEVSDRTAQYNGLDARISQFTKLAEGSTTGDAELADIRVGADGKIYDTAGDAVRGQVSELKGELAELEDIVAVKSPNLFDTSKLVKKSINDSGVPITNLNATALLNIPIEGGMSIVCNGFARRTDIWLGFVYNENDELIDRFGIANYDSTYSGEASWGHYGNKYTAIENAKYFSIYSIDSNYNLGSNYQIEYGDTISEYTPYGAIFFKYDDEIKSIAKKQDKLIAGKGIIIEDNVITCTVEGGGSSEISYEYESKLMSDSYTTLAEISNPKELLFAENNVINEKAKFLFGNHMIIAENNYFVVSQDKTISSTTKSGSLEIAFEYDGNAFEIGCRGLADFRFKVNEGNGWKYLDEKPMNVSTQNGYRTLTQIRFLYAKHRKIIIETSSTVWCLRYDARYQVSPLTLDRPIALFIGSSITEGSASGEFPMASYGAVCSNEFGWEFINLGVGGRGIITPFDSRPSVLDAVSDITQFTDAKYIFIGGSINDSSNNASELTSGLEAIIDTVRESLPDATIVVLGTWSPQPDSNNSVHAITNNAVKSGALTKGCAFIDSMNAQVYDASGNVVQNGTTWVTGTFANASGDNDMSTIGNCERIYTHENGSTDHTHPGRVGHYYIGMRLASACRALKLK